MPAPLPAATTPFLDTPIGFPTSVLGNNDSADLENATFGLLAQTPLNPIPEPYPTTTHGDAYLIDFYYGFFHDAHPILPPMHLLPRLGPLPPCLETVLKFVGAHFTADVSADAYRPAVLSAIAAETEDSFYKVQALLLFSIVLHARNERPEGVQSFSAAVDMAIKLGMNRRLFAYNAAGGDAVRIESMRRTWWDLYMTDAMFTAFDQVPCMITNNVLSDVPLPCDELSYSTGVYLTEPPTARQFYDRVFADHDDDSKYSTYCYAVEASRILRRTLILEYTFNDQKHDLAEPIDASIVSWFRHLPESRSHILGADGSVDQMLFRAYMVIYCASIYLHLPRSNLLTTPVANASLPCATRGLPPAWAPMNPTHAAKAIKAANGLTHLATMRSSVVNTTPFFVCGLVLAAVVQLCACSVRASRGLESRRDRIALIIGELKSMNRTWAISRLVMRHIKLVAREVLEVGVRPRTLSMIEDPGPEIDSLVSSDLWLGDISIEQ